MSYFNENDQRWGHWTAIGFMTLGLTLCFALTASAQSEGGWKTKSWIGYEGQAKTDLDGGGDFDFWMIGGPRPIRPGVLPHSVSPGLRILRFS